MRYVFRISTRRLCILTYQYFTQYLHKNAVLLTYIIHFYRLLAYPIHFHTIILSLHVKLITHLKNVVKKLWIRSPLFVPLRRPSPLPHIEIRAPQSDRKVLCSEGTIACLHCRIICGTFGAWIPVCLIFIIP
jgi:hypothetical protein